MIDPRHLELIHADVDGELDEHQRAELARCLLADPEARALRDEIRRLCKVLDGIEGVEPPAQLRGSILAALPQKSTRPARSGPSRPEWRIAAVLAGVLAAGSIVFQIMNGREPTSTEMAGTLAAQRAVATVDVIQLAKGPVSGRISLTRDSAGLGLVFELIANAPVDVLVRSGGHWVEVNGVGRVDGGRPERATVALPGFGADAKDVSVSLLMGGEEVAHATLRASGGH